MTTITGTLHENLRTFMIISHSIFHRIRNVSRQKKLYRKSKHAFYVNRSVYEIMWKKYGTARQATDVNIIWRMRSACWISKATDTLSEYGTLMAFKW
jgi:hypothetical protein